MNCTSWSDDHKMNIYNLYGLCNLISHQFLSLIPTYHSFIALKNSIGFLSNDDKKNVSICILATESILLSSISKVNFAFSYPCNGWYLRQKLSQFWRGHRRPFEGGPARINEIFWKLWYLKYFSFFQKCAQFLSALLIIYCQFVF